MKTPFTSRSLLDVVYGYARNTQVKIDQEDLIRRERKYNCNLRENFTICWAYFGRKRWVFAYGLGGRGSIPGRVVGKTKKIVLDAALLNTQHYKVRIKSKVNQSRERNSALPYTSVLYLLKKGAFGSPLTKVANKTFTIYISGTKM